MQTDTGTNNHHDHTPSTHPSSTKPSSQTGHDGEHEPKTITATDLIAETEDADRDPAIVSAAELAAEGSAAPILAPRRIASGESALVRPVTDKLVPINVHWHTTGTGYDKSTQMVPCNGAGCVLCAAKNEPKPYLLLVLYFLDDASLGVISIPRGGRAGSLYGQIIPILKKPDCSDLIIQVQRVSKVRYVVKIVKRLDDASHEDGVGYGDDVLAEVAASGIRPADVLATVERMTNEQILAENPQLETVLAAYGKNNKRGGASVGTNGKR